MPSLDTRLQCHNPWWRPGAIGLQHDPHLLRLDRSGVRGGGDVPTLPDTTGQRPTSAERVSG